MMIIVKNSNTAETELTSTQAQAFSPTHPSTHDHCGRLCWHHDSLLSTRPKRCKDLDSVGTFGLIWHFTRFLILEDDAPIQRSHPTRSNLFSSNDRMRSRI